ncbi:MAG: DUF2071 domain-containing protein [bacterium]
MIERRILVNYRVDPTVLRRTLPPPFRPKLHRGHGMAGICLIGLSRVRPRMLPPWLGISSENAAHRTAVEWDDGPTVREGVFIRRRDTTSWLNTLVGGRLFPGIHAHAAFSVVDRTRHVEVAVASDDGVTQLAIAADIADELPTSSTFASVAEASAFFEAGAIGYSATTDPRCFHGLELRCATWRVEPLAVSAARSSFFDDRAVFPAGSVELDCALLMRDIEHEWHERPDLRRAA